MRKNRSDRGRERLGRVVRGARWVFRGVVLVLVVFLLWAAARIVFYRQSDDAEHVRGKRAYLETIVATRGKAPTGPNLVVILFDDLGYGDLGAYGSRAIRTPNIDRVASEGVRFTHAYAASPYCSASRAGLMTGRHAARYGMDHVVQAPWGWKDMLLRLGDKNRRLPEEEITLADVLSAAGYSTALVGKWHLGHRSPSLPNDMGFDSFYGLLFSNDQGKPVVWRDREIVERHPIDQATLTRRYTHEAVEFIDRSAGSPFFLYMPHTFPHIPLFVTDDRLGASAGGLYGDVVEELDESVGAVLDALERNGVADETLIVISSDNGPWFQGSGGGIRGRKFDVFEGGTRVPWIVRWPSRVDAGQVIEHAVTSIDLFPTMLALLGLPAPPDRVIDGQSMLSLLEGQVPDVPRAIFFHQIGVPRGIRQGRFKYRDRHRILYGNPMNFAWAPSVNRGPWLFDLSRDSDESYDVSDRYPEAAAALRTRLQERIREHRENPRGWRD